MKFKFIPTSPFMRIVEIDDAEGLFEGYPSALHCRHCLNRTSYYSYLLPCRLLHVTKSGKAKVEVVSRSGKVYVRYVSPCRVWRKGGEQ